MKFEKQEYQTNCVDNIIEVLRGFDFNNPSSNALKESLERFYQEEEGRKINPKRFSNKLNLDVLMETGTGKTFTYLETIFKLNKEYGLSKFIIFIPRKAIKLGIKQNIALTKDYFKVNEGYKKEISAIDYDGQKSLNSVIDFINNDNEEEIKVLLLTNSAINKKDNILNKEHERTLLEDYQIPIKALQEVKPVIIIDEPHLMTGEKFTGVFKEFNSLYIRFGATFPKEKITKANKSNLQNKNDKKDSLITQGLSNVIYTLDSFKAFEDHLVKKIRVNTISNSKEGINLVKSSKNSFTISYVKDNIEINKEIKLQEDIGAKTGLIEYNSVSGVSIKNGTVHLSNKKTIEQYLIGKTEEEYLIGETIRIHLEKEYDLFKKEIKTLSLFFINRISDFQGDNPVIKKIFDKQYKEQRNKKLEDLKERLLKEQSKKEKNHLSKYISYLEQDYKNGEIQVREGYFAPPKSKNADEATEAIQVDLILNKKEELLSFKTPLRFIFSVWALQEGWDNPNIFNICKLSSTSKENSKRQQVGRGLRIAVNQQGERLTYSKLDENESDFYDINTLDMLLSHHEVDFIESLQKEIIENTYTKLGSKITHKELQEKSGTTDRITNKILGILEENQIITYIEEEDTYSVVKSVYDFMKDNKEKLDFLKEEQYKNILEMFRPSNNRHSQIEGANKKSKLVNIKKNLYKEFQDLWEVINKRARIVYKDINEDSLIDEIVNEFSKEEINSVDIKITTKEYLGEKGIIEKKEIVLDKNKYLSNQKEIQEYVLEIGKQENLPITFILKLFNKLLSNNKSKNNITNNPKKAKDILISCLRNELHKNIIQYVDYNFIGNEEDVYKNTIFASNVEDLKSFKYTLIGKYFDEEQSAKDHYLYDTVVYDSDIEKNTILSDPEFVNENEVVVFAKLPNISIPTPYKNYNPDFAYMVKLNNGKQLFLVLEAKGYDSNIDIPQKEQQKIAYARKFFIQLQQEVAKENKNIKIAFKTRINKIELSSILQDVLKENS